MPLAVAVARTAPGRVSTAQSAGSTISCSPRKILGRCPVRMSRVSEPPVAVITPMNNADISGRSHVNAFAAPVTAQVPMMMASAWPWIRSHVRPLKCASHAKIAPAVARMR